MKTFVIINEQHKLLPEQEGILQKFDESKLIKVPSEGWDLGQINLLVEKSSQTEGYVFVSPVPILLARLSKLGRHVFVFHNDKREKKEINGKTIFTVATTGWQLIEV